MVGKHRLTAELEAARTTVAVAWLDYKQLKFSIDHDLIFCLGLMLLSGQLVFFVGKPLLVSHTSRINCIIKTTPTHPRTCPRG